MTVLCRWDPGCGWGVTRLFELDAREALYRHLKAAHGHDVWAEKPHKTQENAPRE